MEFFGLELIDIITLAAGVAAFLAVFVVWQAATEYNPIGKRLKHIEERKESLRSGIISSKKRSKPVKKSGGISFMRQVVNKFKLVQNQQTEKIINKLLQAGYRSNDALIIFWFARLASPIIMAVIAVILIYGLNMFEGNTLQQAALGIGLVALGIYAPDLWVKNTADKRQDSIRKALPDALDLMVICAEAGLTLDASLTRVSREMARQSEELSDEFGLASIELGFLPERRQALINLTERVPTSPIRSVVATLIQTEKYGTPLAHSLRVLSNEFRNERMMKAEEKAARLPAVMTIPLILFILPMLFIILLGPAACSIADNIVGRF